MRAKRTLRRLYFFPAIIKIYSMPVKAPLLAKIIGWVVGIIAVLQLGGVIPSLLFASTGNSTLILVAFIKLLSGGIAFLAAWKLLKMKKSALKFFIAYIVMLLLAITLLIIYQEDYIELLVEIVIFVAITAYVYTLRPRLV